MRANCKQQGRLLSQLNKINNVFNSNSGIGEKIQEVLEITVHTVKCDTAAICFCREQIWITCYVYGVPDSYIGMHMNNEQKRHAVLAIRTNKPVFIQNALTDRRVNQEHMKEMKLRSVATVPLITDHVEGALFLGYINSNCRFEKSIREFIQLLSSVLSNALQEFRFQELTKQSEEHIACLDAIVDHMADGIIVMDRNINVIKYNAAALKMHNLTSPEALRNVEELFRDFDVIGMDGNSHDYRRCPVFRTLLGEKLINCEYILQNKNDRSIRVLSYSSAPLCDSQGKVALAILSIRDITEQTRQNNRILEAEKEKNEALIQSMKIKDEFTALVSHEFRTPITVILTAIQALETICRNELSHRSKKYIEAIRKNAYRQLKLMNNMLEMSRIEADHLDLKIANCDIIKRTGVIIDSIRSFAEHKKIEITYVSTLVRKVIAIDEDKYEKILLNLLSNAIKYSPPGRHVTVRISQRTVDGKNKVCIQVKDNGIGIPEEMHQLIFEKFMQVKCSLDRQAEGSGLGLSIVKLLLAYLGGDITLESSEGKGSTFTVLLPARKIREPECGNHADSDSRLLQNISIELSDI